MHLLHEVVRHGLLQRVGSHDEGHPPGIAREVQGGLSGRVRAAEHVHVPPGEAGRFRSRAAVEHTGTVERFERREAEPPVADTRRQQHGARSDRAALGQIDRERVTHASEVGRALHEGEPGAECPGLLVRALREVPAADSTGEPEEVPDQRAGGRLTADATLVDDERAETLRRGVDRGRQTRGSGTDDQQIELHLARFDRTARRQGKLRVGRVDEELSIGEHDERELRPGGRLLDQGTALLRIGQAERVRQRATPERLAQLVPRPDHDSPTTTTALGDSRRPSTHSSNKPDTSWLNDSSGEAAGRMM